MSSDPEMDRLQRRAQTRVNATRRRPIKRTSPGTSSIAGASLRTQAEKPVCPQHLAKMKYDPEDLYWHCPFRGCRIISRQNGDHVLASMGNYDGPLSIVIDQRTGDTYLRLAASTFTGSAVTVKLVSGGMDAVPGVAQAESSGRSATILFDDVVKVSHSGTIRR